MVIATNINTELWHTIIQQLINTNWVMTYKYDLFDAGIDFDFVILEKDKEEIIFGWDNWMEGEIKCSAFIMQDIERLNNMQFTYGEPTNLKPSIIKLYVYPHVSPNQNVIQNRDVITWIFISFACPKETKQKKRHFFEGIFWYKTKNRI